jgi:flagellar motor switch protein FliN/FliY
MTPANPGGAEPAAPPHIEPAASEAGALDLLMDMEMPVVVRFGSTRMLLRDLLALSSGSVVEFRRTPEDPVELLVNGRVVARGMVVVVQGNYGVRITEIVSPREAVTNGLGPVARPIRGDA